jgi:hypothetical protein
MMLRIESAEDKTKKITKQKTFGYERTGSDQKTFG